MDPRVKSSLLWGLVGSLSFLVLVQAYHLTTGEFVEIEVVVGMALAVGVTSTALAHLFRPRILRLAR